MMNSKTDPYNTLELCMKPHKQVFGLLSFVIGATSIPLACIGSYAKSVLTDNSHVTATLLESFAKYKRDNLFISTLDSTSAFLVNDERAVSVLILTSIALSLVSIFCSCISAVKVEKSTLWGAGYIFSSLGLTVTNRYAGFLSFTLSVLLIVLLSKYRKKFD